jgi:hypothetical protein
MRLSSFWRVFLSEKGNMKPIIRSFQAEEDYWRIRQFLCQVSLLNDRHDFFLVSFTLGLLALACQRKYFSLQLTGRDHALGGEWADRRSTQPRW